MAYIYKNLTVSDQPLFKDLMQLFGEVFDEPETYQGLKPSDEYIENFLADSSHIVLVALENGAVVGGLVAYELKKFEQARAEIYIYDLAVLGVHQRKGIATSLIENLKQIANKRGTYLIFVQADKNDEGAVSFYETLSTRKKATLNFDIEVD